MDSRLLAGAYSKRYKYIEREQIENLKAGGDTEGHDVLAKARRLSQETNKRRKMAAQKRKQEAAREEKRRQEILNRRHQEQKQATEKYQRCHVGGTQRRFSPTRRGHSPSSSRGHVDLDDALRMVRDDPDSSGHDPMHQRMYHHHHQERSHSGRPGHRNHSPSQGDHHLGASSKRPLSGRPLDASMRAELMERSLRNLTSSRSRFEQQLEHHQQLLLEQQQKSLHDFNQAIRHEIDADTKVQGLDEEDGGDRGPPLRSESLSSLDSLEEECNSSLGNSFRDHQQVLKDFNQVAEQQRDARYSQNNSANNQRNNASAWTAGTDTAGYAPARPQSTKVAARGQQEGQRGAGAVDAAALSTHGHLIGPIPQGYYSSPPGGQVSSTPVIQGNLNYNSPDSLEQHPPYHERHVTVGTALRLPQQSPAAAQPIKQPPPALQYDSQLLAHRKFEPRPNYIGGSSAGPGQGHGQVQGHDDGGGNFGVVDNKQQRVVPAASNRPVAEQPTSALTQNERPAERPKAHVYAWSSPPPVEDEPSQNTTGAAVATPAGTATSGGQQAGGGGNSYSANMVADRVMATHVHPQTSRSISTAATTTWVYQTVNAAHTKDPHYSTATANNNNSTALPPSAASSYHHNQHGGAQGGLGQGGMQTQAATQHVEIPKGQGQKPGTVLTSTGSYPSSTGLQFVSSMPSSYLNHLSMANSRQQQQARTNTSGLEVQGHSGSGFDKKQASQQQQQQRGGSLTQGTLGLVNGRLTVIDRDTGNDPHHQKKITVVEDDTASRKEVKGILKRVQSDPVLPKGSSGVKFNVHDSVEIAKKHMLLNAEAKKKKMKKRGVRFADLHYADDVQEDSDSADSMTDACTTAAAANNSKIMANKNTETGIKSTSLRPRPASAKVTSTNVKATESKVRGPRVASAGPTRHPSATRPKAAAHIIMSGESHNLTGNHGNDSATAGITVHKSQLDKKVMLINNNFMSRLPVSVTAATVAAASQQTPSATRTVPSAGRSGSFANTSAAEANSSAASSHYSTAANGYNKSVMYSQGGEQGKGAVNRSVIITPHTTTVLPSHSHFSNNASNKVVYNENGMRIDRTPTDDEINNLWKNMRTMLDVTDGGKEGAATGSAANAAGNLTTNSDQRQQVHVSHQYIDGAALGIPNGMSRIVPQTYVNTPKATPSMMNGAQSGQTQRPSQQAKNGYLQRYSLLQQRKNPTSGIGAVARTNGVVEQTVRAMPHSGAADPRFPSASIGYTPREDMTESMAEFLAAERMLQGGDVRESRVVAAMDNAQNQQEMYNSIRQKMAKGGPTALSMEEHKLLESLDKLNERLKGLEQRSGNNQQVPNHQVYVHGSGFRGHQIFSSQVSGRKSSTLKPTGRPMSSRFLTRPYH